MTNEEREKLLEELRREAERQIRREKIPLGLSPEQRKDHLLHELRVHQVELQMQNENLVMAQDQLEATHRQYIELFDFAPVGYLLIDKKGIIVKANLTATRLLDVDRNRLVGTNLMQYIERSDVDRWFLHKKQIFEQQNRGCVDLRLRADGSRHVHLRTESVVNYKGNVEVCRVAMIDVTEQEKAREALERSEQQFRTLAEHAPAIVVRYDAQLRHTYINKAVEAATGIERDKFIGKTNMQMQFPEHLCRKWRQLHSGVFKTGEPGQTEFQMRGPQGRRWYFQHAVPEFAKDGSVESVLCIIHDITEVKQAEMKLREQEERLRLVVKGGALGTWDRDMRTETVVWNDLLYEMLGRDPKGVPITPETFFDYIHPDDVGRVRTHLESTLESGDVFEDEFRIVREDGQIRWLVACGRIYRDDDGRPVRMAGVNYDISERREAEQAVRDSEARLRSVLRHRDAELHDEKRKRTFTEDELWETERKYRMLVDNLPAITYLASPDNKPNLYYISPQVRELLGYEPGDQVADIDFWLSRLHPDDRKKAIEEGANARQEDEPFVCEFRIYDNEDRIRWFRNDARTIKDDDGKTLFVQGVMYDITDIRQAQQETAEAKLFAEGIVKTVPDPLMVLESDLTIASANPAFYRAFHVTPEDTLGKYIYEIGNGQWDIPELRTLLEQVIPRDAKVEDFEVEHDFQEIGRRTMLFHARRINRDAGTRPLILVSIEDITLIREQQSRIEADAANLERLTEELLHTEHRERDEAAVALHDSVVQLLAFSKRELGPVIKAVDDKSAQKLKKIRDRINEAIKQSRRLTTDLSSSTLKQFGFKDAVQELLDRFNDEHGFECRMDASEENLRLSDNAESLLYRSVREVLTNIAKHAEARNVLVRINREDAAVRIDVVDDGKGFDVNVLESQAANKGGFGIFSVHQRVTYVGGRFEIQSTIGEGTRVTLIVPLKE